MLDIPQNIQLTESRLLTLPPSFCSESLLTRYAKKNLLQVRDLLNPLMQPDT